MKHIAAITFFLSLVFVTPCFASGNNAIENVFEHKSFTETWSHDGSQIEARHNFLSEAQSYILTTRNGEKIEMSYELIITIMEIRCEINSFEDLSDREVLIIIVATVSQDI